MPMMQSSDGGKTWQPAERLKASWEECWTIKGIPVRWVVFGVLVIGFYAMVGYGCYMRLGR